MLNRAKAENKMSKSIVVSRSGDERPQMSSEIQERASKLKELRDKLKAKDGGGRSAVAATAAASGSGSNTPRTPRTQEILNEFDKFRPKTPSNFKADY
jgi:hypothetical protein